MAQIVYYFWAALALGAPDRPLIFVVPSGNFGNALSCWIAKQMGLPVERLVIATNHNDSLSCYFNQGYIASQPAKPSLSPSMDIQIPSNLERLLFESTGRNGQTTRTLMQNLSTQNRLTLEAPIWQYVQKSIIAQSIDDPATLATISRVKAETGLWVCPHSAVGLAAEQRIRARRDIQDNEATIVTLATAHAAKFPETIIRAIGQPPPSPDSLSSALEAENKSYVRLPADANAVKRYIRNFGRI